MLLLIRLSFSFECRLDQVIESLEKAGTISLPVGGRPPRYVPHLAEIGHELSIRKSLTDGFFGENAPFGVYHPSAFFQTPRSKRNIARYHNILVSNTLCNPIIRSVKIAADNHHLD